MAQAEQYTLPKLPYGYGDLEPAYSRELLELHHDKHHAAYVKGVNKALGDLAESRGSKDYGRINQFQKDLAFHLSGHVLHSLFWQNMSPDGGGDPQGSLATAVGEAFGGADALREHMSQAATSIQGSGWAALCYEPLGGRLLVEQVYDHQSNLGNGTVPLLVLDMWEHAYYLQYRNEKAKWVARFWELVNWADVGKRLDGVKSIDVNLAV
jgi:Fe-Mn family superoxide dismutase